MKASSHSVNLCHIDELPDGAARGFDPFGTGRDWLFVVRRSDSIRAFRNACPHQGASLPWQKDAYLNADGSRIVCSAHGAQFDIDSGQCLLGAAFGHSLQRLAVTVTYGGHVMLQLPPNV